MNIGEDAQHSGGGWAGAVRMRRTAGAGPYTLKQQQHADTTQTARRAVAPTNHPPVIKTFQVLHAAGIVQHPQKVLKRDAGAQAAAAAARHKRHCPCRRAAPCLPSRSGSSCRVVYNACGLKQRLVQRSIHLRKGPSQTGEQ